MSKGDKSIFETEEKMGILSALVHETLNFSEASSLFKTHFKFPNYAL